jgi:hypothetical protein
MSGAETTGASLRMEQAESSRLAWAPSFSLVLHPVIFGGYETNKRYGWITRVRLPAWLEPVRLLAEMVKKKVEPPSQPKALQNPETPLVFVDVSPAQVTAEPPPSAKYYSDKNSKAANPESGRNTDTPRINGTQNHTVKTEDVARQKFSPLQPMRPAEAKQADREQTEERARPAERAGDLALGKPQVSPRQEPGEAERSRPRTVREALARQQQNRISGQKMMQEGGVSRHLEISSLDARATTFGAYDAALIEIIQDRWLSLLDQRDYASDARGKVVLQFVLHPDGRVTELNIAENTTNETLGLLCVKAVSDPAPFPAWSMAMRLEIGETRHIQFTFFYY